MHCDFATRSLEIDIFKVFFRRGSQKDYFMCAFDIGDNSGQPLWL